MRTSIVVSLVLAVSLVGGCGNGFSDASVEVISDETLASAGLQYYWQLDLDLPKDEQIIRLHAMDETLYAVTDLNRVFALDASSGVVKWAITVAGPEEKLYQPYHYDALRLTDKPLSAVELIEGPPADEVDEFDAVIWNSYTRALVIDRATGQIYRDIPFAFTANTGAACNGTTMYVGSSDGFVNAVRFAAGSLVWSAPMSGGLTAPMEWGGAEILAADTEGLLVALRPGRLEQRIWSQQLNGPVSAEFSVDHRGLFIGTEENFIYGLTSTSGDELWPAVITQGPIRDPMQVGDHSVFQYARNDRFYALDITSGEVRWTHEDARRVVMLVGGKVYLVDAGGSLLRVDEVLGEQDLSLPMPAMTHFADNVRMPAIFTAAPGGRLYCIRLLSAGYLTPEQIRSTQPGR
jgi:outer membrane protein assembly factor BamB